MTNIKLTISYDGTDYHGWQKQSDRETVQGVIEATIKKLFREEVSLQGASRTDAGVHAQGQVANFRLEKEINLKKIQEALNSKLPKDVVILKVEEVEDSFNARFAARGKHYQYVIYNVSLASPFEKNYSLFFPYPLNIEKMQAAAGYLMGTLDFASFGVNPGKKIDSTVRTIDYLKVVKKEKKIFIDIKGDSFLYKMVRTIIGTLLEVGREKKNPEEVREILKKRDRTFAAKTASASGLYLKEVFY